VNYYLISVHFCVLPVACFDSNQLTKLEGNKDTQSFKKSSKSLFPSSGANPKASALLASVDFVSAIFAAGLGVGEEGASGSSWGERVILVDENISLSSTGSSYSSLLGFLLRSVCLSN
jgi:hypothetical protein